MNPSRSVDRALTLLKSEKDDEYFLLKLLPQPASCCCSDCWPNTWREINRTIAPAQPVPHEGDSLITVGAVPLVIESHESGPEIILLLTQWCSQIASLLKPISEIVSTFAKSLSRERPKGLARIRIESYRVSQGQATHIAKLDVDFPLDKRTVDTINSTIQDMLTKNTEGGNQH